MPLFIEELTQSLIESEALREIDGRFVLQAPLDGLSIPATLHDSLAARLDRLGEARELVQLGATLGREFSHELLAAVSTLRPAALERQLAKLLGSDLVHQRGRGSRLRYVFKHALVQEAAYESLLKSKRVEHHHRIVEVLEERFPDITSAAPELLARHCDDGGLADKAIGYWERAGENATERSANVEAAEHFKRALELLLRMPEDEARDRRELIEYLNSAASGSGKAWSIIQKQTGADRLCIGGALGANAHGRGLRFKPFIADVESFELVGASGETISASRAESAELFRLAIGGYGLFGVIATVDLRLMERTRLRRVVEIVDIPELMAAFEKRITAGYIYGDCQFSIDPASPDFLMKGVFSCYEPVGEDHDPGAQKRLQASDWRKLYVLAHDDAQQVFDVYSSYYLSTSGQIYWSDTHQLSTYVDDYHRAVDAALSSKFPGSEMITEVYVPRDELPKFLADLALDFRRNGVKVIYGTIRLIEQDDESFLPWAKQSYACIVMNLHIARRPQCIAKAATDFRRIIDRAVSYGGSYFLTYHRWAGRSQIEACYPQMPDFLALKDKHDPLGLFQTDWYRDLMRMFG